MISVIIPAYNLEDYIVDCLRSVFSQNFTSFEVIVIDDGSTDNTVSVIQNNFADKKNLKVVSQENGGLSNARNHGLEIAKGKYILFIDGDDWLANDNVLSELYSAIDESDADFLQFGLSFVNGSKITKYIVSPSAPICGLQILEDTINIKNLYTSAWSKLYSSDFLRKNNLRFLDGLVNEDTAFSIMIAAKAEKAAFLPKVVYCSREREGSLSRSAFIRMFSSMHQVMNLTRDFLMEEGKYEVVKEAFEARYVRSMLYNLLQSAQRSDYTRFKADWDFCMQHTDYRKNGSFAAALPLPHSSLYHLSKWPRGFFTGFRLLNKFGIKMH